MALVTYPDSAEESETEDVLLADAPPKKKPRQTSTRAALPSLPTAFHDLYASSIRVSVRDDPNLHGGRRRVIPHVEGNWPTHIYLECNQIFDCWAISNVNRDQGYPDEMS